MGGCCSTSRKNQDSDNSNSPKVLEISRKSDASVSVSTLRSEGIVKSAKSSRRSNDGGKNKEKSSSSTPQEEQKKTPPSRLRITHDEVLDRCSLEDD